jgi:hypothetical protein
MKRRRESIRSTPAPVAIEALQGKIAEMGRCSSHSRNNDHHGLSSTAFPKITTRQAPQFEKEVAMQEHKKGDQFTRRQFMWLDQVLADQSLPAAAFRVAYVISRHIHRGTGDAWLGTRRLSEKSGVGRKFAMKAMRALETAGHLAVEDGNGRGNTNRYRMVEKGVPQDVNGVRGDTHFDEINGVRQDENGVRQDRNGVRQDENGVQRTPDSLNNPLKEPLIEPLTPAAPAKPASLSDTNPSKASFFEQQEREAKEGKEESAPKIFRAPPRENATVAPPPVAAAGCAAPKRRHTKSAPPADDPTFEAFWQAYPSKVAKGGARKAYQAAREKASADAIIAGARRYVDSDTVLRGFVCNPATWLNQERWADQPAPARVIDQDGNPAMPPPRANGHDRYRSKCDEAADRNMENFLKIRS